MYESSSRAVTKCIGDASPARSSRVGEASRAPADTPGRSRRARVPGGGSSQTAGAEVPDVDGNQREPGGVGSHVLVRNGVGDPQVGRQVSAEWDEAAGPDSYGDGRHQVACSASRLARSTEPLARRSGLSCSSRHARRSAADQAAGVRQRHGGEGGHHGAAPPGRRRTRGGRAAPAGGNRSLIRTASNRSFLAARILSSRAARGVAVVLGAVTASSTPEPGHGTGGDRTGRGGDTLAYP